MKTLLAIKGSIIAGVVVAVLGLLSMGILGFALYYACYPLLAPLYGNLNDWHGDDVWPATIWAGMFWAIFFPVAGFADLRLKRVGAAGAARVLSWLAILWAGAAVVWFYVASSSSYITFPTATAAAHGLAVATRDAAPAFASSILFGLRYHPGSH